MSQKRCHVQGCTDGVEGHQVELRVPLDDSDPLSQLTVRTWVCTNHRQRFAEAGLEIDELSPSIG